MPERAEGLRARVEATDELVQPVGALWPGTTSSTEVCNIAEVALLGSMLLSLEARDGALAMLKAHHFRREAHAVVFDTIRALVDENLPVDLVSLTAVLIDGGQLDEVGGAAAVSLLTDPLGCPSPAHWEFYATVVLREAERRRLRRVLVRAVADLDRGEDPDAVAERVRLAVTP